MSKEERLKAITDLVDQRGTVRVSEIVEVLNVSDMTVRRDLSELEDRGVLTKMHGGAKSKNGPRYKELSHDDKHMLNRAEKKEIAAKAVKLIEEGDTLFLGPGTTVELLAGEIVSRSFKSLRIITNCWPVFKIISQKKTDTLQVYLVGGDMREVTQSFVGEMTNMVLEKMHFSKMFFSSNGVKGSVVMTSSFEEGYTQQMVMSRSLEKYLLVDTSKIGKEDFSTFADLIDVTAVIMNESDTFAYDTIEKFTEVM